MECCVCVTNTTSAQKWELIMYLLRLHPEGIQLVLHSELDASFFVFFTRADDERSYGVRHLTALISVLSYTCAAPSRQLTAEIG